MDKKDDAKEQLASAMELAEKMGAVAAVGRSDKAAFKAAVFMHAKQPHVPFSTVARVINRKEVVSVFGEQHVKESLSATATLNDALQDIGDSFAKKKPQQFFRNGGRGRGDRAYVARATFRQPQQRFSAPAGDQNRGQPLYRGRGQGRGQPRGRGRGRGRGQSA